ncbi:unnamed protein product [Adineta steineri]|uniref:Uncharacterized protein n=4 Tax=Adineta steineri TaxID=433720 RepID=A0A815L7C0_9BILA|nr:unnamed protein product [Adineta steineri]CAF4071203.1 unnamed protein product [Adineta steineri]
MKIYFLFAMIISNCLAKQDPPRILHGIFSDSNTTQVYYGSLNFDTENFDIFNSLNINDIGNPQRIKYAVLPLTYDPNDDVIYMAAPNNDNRPILSVINATTGILISTFKSISNTIISLQFDIFQKQLFAHIETEKDNVTLLAEIDINNGNIKQVLATIRDSKPTHISSYCPICRKYFLMMIEDQSFVYTGVNTSNQGGVDWKAKLNYSPISMKFDYKTFTMYTTYVNTSIRYVSSLGILDRTSGGISKNVGIISESPDVGITSFSAFDIMEKIYYASITLDSVFPRGISYVNVKNSRSDLSFFPKTQYDSHAWFVKQFVH